MSNGELPPPGWYPDPERPGQQRWWDGNQWTDHRAPLAQDPGSSPAGDSGGVPGWEVRPTSGQGPGDWGSSGGQPGSGSQSGWGAPGGGSSGGWSGGAPPEVKPWLWQSIAATVLCCLPAGIVAIVFAAQAQSAINSQNWSTAQEKAAKARTWTLVSVVLGLIAIPIIVWREFGAMGGL